MDMLLRRRRTTTPADDPNVVVEHGPSLAKGPALVVGSVLVAFGLASLLKNHDFPSFSSSFPDGTVQGTNFLGFEVNGWTAFFSITAGALLLVGAAQHHLAKMMSLLVGLALAACAVIALIDGQDVLGLAAANGWTKLGFAVAGGALLLNALMPRTTRRREIAPATGAGTGTGTAAAGPADRDRVTDAPVVRRRRFGRPVRDGGLATADDRTTVAERDRGLPPSA
jgi:peptidoglycan/LPS O-acetylase OafA/YrhL